MNNNQQNSGLQGGKNAGGLQGGQSKGINSPKSAESKQDYKTKHSAQAPVADDVEGDDTVEDCGSCGTKQ